MKSLISLTPSSFCLVSLLIFVFAERVKIIISVGVSLNNVLESDCGVFNGNYVVCNEELLCNSSGYCTQPHSIKDDFSCTFSYDPSSEFIFCPNGYSCQSNNVCEQKFVNQSDTATECRVDASSNVPKFCNEQEHRCESNTCVDDPFQNLSPNALCDVNNLGIFTCSNNTACGINLQISETFPYLNETTYCLDDTDFQVGFLTYPLFSSVLGDPCGYQGSSYGVCTGNTYCSSSVSPPVCQRLRVEQSEGGSCGGELQFCEEGFYCDSSSKKCTKAVGTTAVTFFYLSVAWIVALLMFSYFIMFIDSKRI